MNPFDRHLFLLLNASPDAAQWQIALALLLAKYLLYALPPMLVLLWVRGTAQDRSDLVHAVMTVSVALLLGQVIAHLWPHTRPFIQHLGTNLLPHADNASFPSDHTLIFCGLGLGLLAARRLSWLALPLTALGLLVGWSRIYLGVHFPFDIAGAIAVAALAALICRAASEPIERAIAAPAQRLYRHLSGSELPPSHS